MLNNITQTPLLVLTNIVAIVCLFLLLQPAMSPPYRVSKWSYWLSVFLMFFFCLYSFWGLDWFGYLQTYEKVRNGLNTNLEDFYLYIIDNYCKDYLTFRVIVWGGALLILFEIVRRLSIQKHLFLFVFSCFFLIFYSYARVSLAMAIMFYGLSLLYKPYKRLRLFSYLVGILFIYLSLYLHKSAVLGVAVISLSLLSMCFNRKRVLLFSVLFFPFMVEITRDYLEEIMIMEIDNDTGFTDYLYAGQRYFQHENSRYGFGKIVSIIVESIPYYLIAYCSLKLTFSKLYSLVPNDVKIFIRVSFILVLCSLIFLFDLGYNTNIIYVRFLRFCIIPASIVLTYLYQVRFKPKLLNCIIFLLGFNVTYALLYTLYNVYLK